ncbi:MAG: radical SAM protein [Planctomycetota bacterium]
MLLPTERLSRALANDTLHLIVLPTEACNFRCFYCYEDFRLARMDERVQRGLKRWIEQRAPTLSQLTISWFGGEPLLALDVVEDVLDHVASLRQRHPRLQFHSDMTTNAWQLTRDVFERLRARGVRLYQISFDGPQEVHDRRRVRADGAGTFERIWANVTRLRELPGDFEVRLRVHVDRENRGDIPRFLDQCRAEFGTDARFKLFLRPLSRLGGPNDARIDVLGLDGESALVEARAEARLRGLALFEEDGEKPVCYAAEGNSFVVRADGRLSKCTVALAHPANDIGRLHEDGRVEIDAAKTARWTRGLFSGKGLELLCPMVGLADVPHAAV